MLQDRKELIESELIRLKDKAAKIYLSYVTNVNNIFDMTQYDDIREKISGLEFDLKIINEILEKDYK
jgi:hypothetical protein